MKYFIAAVAVILSTTMLFSEQVAKKKLTVQPVDFQKAH